ncbi:ubiquitin carboxyl-terminal hydrolase MINDY-3-like isoform X2 [Salvia splendens]|uniref:ubiquitin carboxyl-terminal hydrolase MINDY-3-like isoform X2 n=1 Tax=Salvia splendens TaxID=180675 RepID=UPI001C262243|nr:ubiquitin carboxyl-terminal hydrolase MINDY-3-like isoform X2 [Salvia splendens]
MSIVDQEDEDLQMALRLSMQQHESPEPKRSKSKEDSGAGDSAEESPEAKTRRRQRELMAAAAEKRMVASSIVEVVEDVDIVGPDVEDKGKGVSLDEGESKDGDSGVELPLAEANQLFSMIFGEGVSKDVLTQWCNQGIRFSSDPETSMGLVQHEGGPCGVLAAIQGFVLKYLLFSPEETGNAVPNNFSNLAIRRESKSVPVPADIFSSLSEERKSRALVRSMSEILFLCGSNKAAVIASLNVLPDETAGAAQGSEDEINTCTSRSRAIQVLEALLPVFRSRFGALLFLISALLSRGLHTVQEDRDDPSQPLVTAPFGHASQEIVNLLLSGNAVANVFDGKIDLGDGMSVKGISTTVQVGFLTLLESLNYCKVGQYLKCPNWPIWVVGSESHYTVLFALDTKVQEENELENRESQIRKAFDAHDQSGGGGFISVEAFHQIIKELRINLAREKVDQLCSTDFIVWNELWHALLDLDQSLGGLKDPTGPTGKEGFHLYHFNGIAKLSASGSQASSGNEIPIQRPRLTNVRVTIPPRWTSEEMTVSLPVVSTPGTNESNATQVSCPQPAQHAPLVDCIRTRWPSAVCNWDGDAPSIV